jgi:hypothetical protein
MSFNSLFESSGSVAPYYFLFRLSGKIIQANIMKSDMTLAKIKNVSLKLYPVSENII